MAMSRFVFTGREPRRWDTRLPHSCLTGAMSLHGPLIARMQEIDDRLVADNDERRHFHGAYLRSTKSAMADADAGRFIDPAWAELWGIAFANLYLEAFTAWEEGNETPEPWQVAFAASKDHGIPPLRHVRLGINAHINYDLPQALLAVITDDEFADPVVLERRAADHEHVDAILVKRVAEEDKRMEAVEEPATAPASTGCCNRSIGRVPRGSSRRGATRCGGTHGFSAQRGVKAARCTPRNSESSRRSAASGWQTSSNLDTCSPHWPVTASVSFCLHGRRERSDDRGQHRRSLRSETRPT